MGTRLSKAGTFFPINTRIGIFFTPLDEENHHKRRITVDEDDFDEEEDDFDEDEDDFDEDDFDEDDTFEEDF